MHLKMSTEMAAIFSRGCELRRKDLLAKTKSKRFVNKKLCKYRYGMQNNVNMGAKDEFKSVNIKNESVF